MEHQVLDNYDVVAGYIVSGLQKREEFPHVTAYLADTLRRQADASAMECGHAIGGKIRDMLSWYKPTDGQFRNSFEGVALGL